MSHLLLSPLSWTLLGLFALAIAPHARKRLRATSWLVVSASIVAMTPFGANLLLQPLETWARDANRPCEKAMAHSPAPLIALSGGFQRAALDASDIAALSHSSYLRGVHAAALVRAGAVSHVYVSGGPYQNEVSEAAVMASLLQLLGVSQTHLTLEQQARDTWANAAALKRLLRPQDRSRPMHLATTAMHMRRAMLAFQAAGLDVCPSPTDWQHIPLSLSLGYFWPQRSSLDKVERVLHEWAGLVAYQFRQQAAARMGSEGG